MHRKSPSAFSTILYRKAKMLARNGIFARPSIPPSCAAGPSVNIISHENKIFVKFSFLTEILYTLCYNESAKGRGDRIDSIEKSRISGCTAYLRSRDAVLRCMARRGGDRAEQGNTAVSGVCGNWITKMRRRKKAAFRSFSHAFGDCSKRERHC